MKIGILTFHWATNYGAVLQTYALQQYLTHAGHHVEVINYKPAQYNKTLTGCIKIKSVKNTAMKIFEYIKEKKIDKFRNTYIVLSSHKYQSYVELKKIPPPYEAYITGSDQVWNPSFTSKGEGSLTLSYFLDFGSSDVKRIAYAVSFGCLEYPEVLIRQVMPSIDRFDALSVRENSGKNLLHNMGYQNVRVLPDPTLLLQRHEYDKFTDPKVSATNSIATYLVNTRLDNPLKCAIGKVSKFVQCTTKYICGYYAAKYGMENWITAIKSSKYVITDSYHGVIFAIIFRIPFVALPVQGTGIAMNDRLDTLLSALGLKENICNGNEVTYEEMQKILCAEIQWDSVHYRIQCLNKKAYEYIGCIGSI